MPSDAQESVPAVGPPPRTKYRVRFRKAGDLRLVSHHDLMHCLERMFRRAGLPVHSTQGFNPRPRLWFAQSLALGIVGLNEALELELTEPIPAEELHRRLADHCPPGMAILSARVITAKAPAQVRRAFFRLPLAEPIADLAGRCAALLAQEHCWVERARPQPRRLDIRPFIGALQPEKDGLTMTLWVTPYGAARPDEVVAALGLTAVLDAGAVLERTDVELADEATDATPPPARLPTHPSARESPTDERRDTTLERAPATRPTAIVTGPLSFDT